MMSGDREARVKATKEEHGRLVLRISPYIDISYSEIGKKNVERIRSELEKIYGNLDGVADGIAIEIDDTVYVVDSGRDGGEISFGILEISEISDEKIRAEYVRRKNGYAISKGCVSDGLSLGNRGGSIIDSSSDIGHKFGDELSADNGKPEDNRGGISFENKAEGALTATESEQKIKYNRKKAKYISYEIIGSDNVKFIRSELKRIYGKTDGILNEIAIFKGDNVFILDSGNENGTVTFGVRYIKTITDTEIKEDYIRRINGKAVSKGEISDGLSSSFKRWMDNDLGRNMRREPGTKLSTDRSGTEYNSEGIYEENEYRRGSGRVSGERIHYSKKEIYKHISKKEYAIISSRIMEDNSRFMAREKEIPKYGKARSADYFYVYENFAPGNFGVLQQIKITDINREYIASVEAKVGEINGEQVIRSAGELNRMLEILKARQGRNRNNHALDSRGLANSENGGISVRETESNRIGYSKSGNRDSGTINENFSDEQKIKYNLKRVSKQKKSRTYYSQYHSTAMQWAFSADKKPGDIKVLYNSKDNTWNKLVADGTEDGYGILFSIEDTPENVEIIKNLHKEINNDENHGTKQRVSEGIYENFDVSRDPRRGTVHDSFYAEERGTDGRARGIYEEESASNGTGDFRKGARDSGTVNENFSDEQKIKFDLKKLSKTESAAYKALNEQVEKTVTYKEALKVEKRRNKELWEINKVGNRVVSKAQSLKELKTGTFLNASQYKSDLFKGSIGQLSKIKHRGNLNESGTRRIAAMLRKRLL